MSIVICSVGTRHHQVLSLLNSEAISSWTNEHKPAASSLLLVCLLSAEVNRDMEMFHQPVLLVQSTASSSCVQLASCFCSQECTHVQQHFKCQASLACCLVEERHVAGTLAGLQPSSVNQTSMLDKQRAMPWREALNEPVQQAEPTCVVAGTEAGMLHVWVASGVGHHTWQPVATPQQVIANNAVS